VTPAERSAAVKQRAEGLGFSATGVAAVGLNPHAAELDAWLAAGFAGTMTYLHRQAARRRDPRTILPGATTAVVTLTNYFHEEIEAAAPGRRARVAQYAWSDDYHGVLADRLAALGEAIRAVAPGAHTRAYVDAGPVPERELAQQAGLGWVGKNMMLIHPHLGSFTFLGVVLTDADLAPDMPFEADRCGSCRRCVDACPTDAFVAPHMLDARRCIAYLTIEQRSEFTETQRAMVGDWLFGCDVCQDVCPWNVTFAQPTTDPALAPRPELVAPSLPEFENVASETFERRFGNSPLTRPGLAGMRRNAAAVRANQG